ncbi:MAG: VWA domain-containing protein [Acidobacteria bacterium]|nr:VWA domain-containing protein [Acidobacteriota bacterium]
MNRPRSGIFALGVCLSCLLVAGRVPTAEQSAEESAGQAAEPQITFKTGVDLIRFDVRVTDSAGRPITDLRPDEIVISESGTVMPTLLFQRVTEPSDTYVEAARRAVTAEVSSNEAFPRGHLYILVFDQQHITAGNEQRARIAAEQFIRTRVRPSDRVAVYAVPGPGPQLGFTADRARAIAELSSIRGSYQRVVTTPFGRLGLYEAHRIVEGDEKLIVDTLERLTVEGSADLLGLAAAAGNTGRGGGVGTAEDGAMVRRLLVENARVVVQQSDAESRQFLQRLADVITALGDLEGRKSVVLFSEGFFQDNLSRELETVAAAAAQTYSVFYSFDLNARTAPITQAYVQTTSMASEIQARIAPLGTLAVETDGLLVLDAASRTTDALNQIADQAQDYYLVGFAPSAEATVRRGEYRRVSIRVTRPGARVSARTGYALRPDVTELDRRRAISSVLGAPFVQQGLKVDYTTYVMRADQPGQHRVVLSLAADLPLRAAAGDYADVVFVARDVRDGRVVASGSDTISLPAEARSGSPLGTGAWRIQFNVPAGTYLMRTVVREPGGLVGSADRRLEILPLDGQGVNVSDLVLGSASASLPVQAKAYTEDGLTGLIETYARTAAQLSTLSVRVELRAASDDHVVTSTVADLHDPQALDTGIIRRAPFSMPLASVAPGAYVARAVVRAGGEVVAERTRHLDIVEGLSPARVETPAIAPYEIIRGVVARRYLSSLQTAAAGTPWADAAAKAVAQQWELVEVSIGAPPVDAAVAQALRGLALFAREDFAGAADALDRAFTADSADALTAFFLGWAQEFAGQTRAALSGWRAAAHLDPTLVPAHLALAEGYVKLGEPALAAQALRAGLVALPNSPELLARLEALIK